MYVCVFACGWVLNLYQWDGEMHKSLMPPFGKIEKIFSLGRVRGKKERRGGTERGMENKREREKRFPIW